MDKANSADTIFTRRTRQSLQTKAKTMTEAIINEAINSDPTTRLKKIFSGFYAARECGIPFTVLLREDCKLWEGCSKEISVSCRYPTRRQAEACLREYCQEAAEEAAERDQ